MTHAQITTAHLDAAQPVQPVQPAAMSQELWIKPDAPDLIAFINSTPVIQSLLYDLNLLPEQVDCEKHWNYMVSVYDHLRPQDAIAQEPVQPTSADYAMGYAEGFNDACKHQAINQSLCGYAQSANIKNEAGIQAQPEPVQQVAT